MTDFASGVRRLLGRIEGFEKIVINDDGVRARPTFACLRPDGRACVVLEDRNNPEDVALQITIPNPLLPEILRKRIAAATYETAKPYRGSEITLSVQNLRSGKACVTMGIKRNTLLHTWVAPADEGPWIKEGCSEGKMGFVVGEKRARELCKKFVGSLGEKEFVVGFGAVEAPLKVFWELERLADQGIIAIAGQAEVEAPASLKPYTAGPAPEGVAPGVAIV